VRSEGVQQVAVAAWGLWLSSLVPRRSVLSRLDYYVSAQLLLLLGTARARGGERGEVAGMCALLTLPACFARLPPRHRYGWQIATIPIQVVRKTVTRRLVFGLCAPLVAALFVVAVWLLPRQASFMPTTRIPVLLRRARMKLAAPIVDKCLVRDGQHHHPATLTCAAGSLGREERSALLVSSPPAAGYPARSICTERRALRAKALNLPSL
jgi:hypothetical protein